MTGSEREAELLARVPSGLYINGVWEQGGGEPIPVTDPATGEVLKRIANADAADGLRALDAAVAAAQGWAATAPRVRAEILRRAFDLLQERRADFALLMTLEMGKPLAEANGEVTYGGEFLRWFSEEAVRISGRYGHHGRVAAPGGPLLPDHPVELPARHGDAQDRPGPRRRLHGRDQARRAHAADHPVVRAAPRGRRAAGRRGQRHHHVDRVRRVRADHR